MRLIHLAATLGLVLGAETRAFADLPEKPQGDAGTMQTQLQPDGSCKHDDTTFRCVRVVKVYDGDTITVEIPGVHPLLGKKISVRVRGVDAAEVRTKDPCEKTAGRAAQRLVESELRRAKQVVLKNVGRDKYFRVLADVEADGRSISELLLKNRLAYAYDGGTKSVPNWCTYPRALGRTVSGAAQP